mgnify:CR=1 FL=1
MGDSANGVREDDISVEVDAFPPMVAFVNTKSGGQKGASLLAPLQEVFGADRTYDLFGQDPVGPMIGLRKHMGEPGLRVVVAGGDGTVNWVMEVMAKIIEESSSPLEWAPVAVLPLGTGNDLSRQFHWGHAYLGYDLQRLPKAVAEAPVKMLDRWRLDVSGGTGESDGWVDQFSKTFINYFGIGVDGKVVSLFEECRKAYSWLYCCRCMNNAIYGWFGMTYCCRCQPKLSNDYELEIVSAGDGENGGGGVQADGGEARATDNVDIPSSSQGVIILNIQSFMGGVELWRHPDCPATPGDGKLSVCSVNGPIHLGRIKGNIPCSNADFLAQGQEVLIRCPKQTKAGSIQAQVDGEAITLKSPGRYKVTKLSQAAMLDGPITAGPLCDFCC